MALCASGYYDGVEFHRNIPGFMIQGASFLLYLAFPDHKLDFLTYFISGGDPTGKGKGGQSIYGENFKDEFSDTLKHSSRGTGTLFKDPIYSPTFLQQKCEG